MKKTLFTLILVCLLLCSCSDKRSEAKQIKTDVPFSCTVNINQGSLNFSANLSFINSASATLEFLSPNEVKGLIFELEGEQIYAKYKGLSFSLPSSDTGVYNAARLIFSSLSSAGGKNTTVNENGDIEITDSVKGVDYALIFDKKSGSLKALKSASLGLNMDFENFVYSD